MAEDKDSQSGIGDDTLELIEKGDKASQPLTDKKRTGLVSIPGGEFVPKRLPSSSTLDQEVETNLRAENNKKAFFAEVEEVTKPFLEELKRKTDRRVRDGKYEKLVPLKKSQFDHWSAQGTYSLRNSYQYSAFGLDYVEKRKDELAAKHHPTYHTVWDYPEGNVNPYTTDRQGAVTIHPLFTYDIWFDLVHKRLLNRLLNQAGTSSQVEPKSALMVLRDTSWETDRNQPEKILLALDAIGNSLTTLELAAGQGSLPYLHRFIRGSEVDSFMQEHAKVQRYGSTGMFVFLSAIPEIYLIGGDGRHRFVFNGEANGFERVFHNKENRDFYLQHKDKLRTDIPRTQAVAIIESALHLLSAPQPK